MKEADRIRQHSDPFSITFMSTMSINLLNLPFFIAKLFSIANNITVTSTTTSAATTALHIHFAGLLVFFYTESLSGQFLKDLLKTNSRNCWSRLIYRLDTLPVAEPTVQQHQRTEMCFDVNCSSLLPSLVWLHYHCKLLISNCTL